MFDSLLGHSVVIFFLFFKFPFVFQGESKGTREEEVGEVLHHEIRVRSRPAHDEHLLKRQRLREPRFCRLHTPFQG